DQIAEAIRIRKMREAGKGAIFRYGDEGHAYDGTPPGPTSGEMLTHGFLPQAPAAGPGKAWLSSSSSSDLRKEVADLLRLVRINDPERILNLYPHELSGGMRQRVMIAIALSGRPSLLIADEPTSALDLTIQAQVLTLMKELLTELKTSILFISHDLGVVAEMVDDLGVMYAGELVEFGPIPELFQAPRHPYTKALLHSFPTLYKDQGALPALRGSVPNLSRLPPGCSFAPRCALAKPICHVDPGPRLRVPKNAPTPRHEASCHFAEEVTNLP
ncbi:MAG: ABC transporter ATP-binding protein, partial [Thermoplasmata archaeon]|nr:ABC transporter ATP-binding protein [Thermoplasmata archaeon]